jgi:hypothetical protein
MVLTSNPVAQHLEELKTCQTPRQGDLDLPAAGTDGLNLTMISQPGQSLLLHVM